LSVCSAWGPPSLLFNGYRFLSRRYFSRGVILTVHLYLAPRLLCLCALVGWTPKTLQLTCTRMYQVRYGERRNSLKNWMSYLTPCLTGHYHVANGRQESGHHCHSRLYFVLSNSRKRTHSEFLQKCWINVILVCTLDIVHWHWCLEDFSEI
jgi:hypothetical protein